ncbi:MAG: carboxypeptidase regulatory-like domain-containing protein, partial [Verrucomicrobia bacterium]|nr:carboxypeptidase regulatory-like domain-containing protein [Verrucomicrobiota bacterium]
GLTSTFALAAGATNNTIDAGYYAPATIGDFVWDDANANGQQDVGETGLDGVTVTLYRPGFGPDGIAGNADDSDAVATTTTSGGGAYGFAGLPPGTYQVNFGTLAGYNRTLADNGADATDSDANAGTGLTSTFALAAGATNNTIDAGYYAPATIGDFVWDDANANGQQDGGETGLDGVTVTLYRPGLGPDGIAGNADDSDAVATTTTAGGGAYGFTGLPPGTYQVNFGSLGGYNRTLADNGADATDSDANAGTGLTTAFALAAGETNNTIDAGYYAPATIGDFVWDDANANGQQDGGETGLDGVTVTLYRPGFGPDGIPGNADDSDAVATTTTAGGGAYGFASLPPGTYQVNFGSLGGYNRTLADNGADATDSDADAGTGLTSTFALAAGATNNTIDAGYYEPGTVFGHLYIDVNGNGAQDSGEPDLADVNVVVTDVNGNPQVVSTDSNGDWAATVPPGATTANVDETDPQYPVGHTQTEGDDPTGVTAVSGNNVDAGNDGYFQPGSVTGSVLADTDNDNDGDISIGGVTLTLLNSVDATVATTTTAPDGSYSFANLPPGTYRVVETQPSGYLSVTDKDGGNPDEIQGIVVVAGGVNSANDFIEEEPGAIAGAVLADTDGNGSGDVEISGVTLTLLDAAGDPVDGDPNTPGTQFVTSVTDSKGNYNFNDIPPGTYGVLETQPGGYLSVSDKDGGDPDRIHPIVVPPGGTSTGNNFIEEQPATIGDFVWDDANANGQQDGGETGLDGVTVTLYRPGFGPDGIAGNADDSDAVATTTTAGGGAYSFASLPPGTYQINFGTLAGYSRTLADNGADATDSDANAGTGLTGNIVLAAGATNNTIDAGYYQPGTVFGHLYINVNGNGAQDSGEPDLADVNVVVTDVNGNPQVVSTDSNGDWAATVPPGATTANVDETDPQYPVGYTQTEGDDPTDVTAVSGNNVDAGNDGYFLSASLGDCVWMDLDKDGVQNDGPASGANGVTVELLDGSGAVIATTATADDGSGNPGFYHFGNLAPGTYSVRFTLPDGVVFAWHNGSLSATDNSDPDRTTGETAQITLSAGDNITYLDAGLKCPDTWADWKQLHPGEDATGNLDADAYGNFAEYAFAMPDGGTGSPHLDATAWIIRPSTLAPGTLEAVFVRPTGWNTGLAQGAVTYTLQYAASIGNPTVWQSVTIDLTNATVADNGDCTETVVIHDLETLTGLTGGTGVVRIEATQSDPTGPDSGATTHSEPEGWTETPLERCCQTYGTPYQRETVFTGTVGAVSGQDLAFTGQDLTGLLLPGVSYYAEVLSGDNSGQRFDVAATGDGTVTLATDADILSAAPPFNTLSTVPASLAGDIIAIRPHWTLGGLFPAAGLVASGANTTADQVQTYAAGAWTTYWLYDLGDADPATARWVKTGDPTLADAGGAVIPPGQGMFFTKRVSAAALLTYGEIRTNPFVRPLATGAQSNLVSGGYPVDQSPVGRELTTAEGFLGTKDFKTADSIFVWQNDASPPFNSGYDTYWLLNSTTPQALDRWVKQGDPTITPRDNSVLLEYDRAVFLRTAADQTGYKTAAPWTP